MGGGADGPAVVGADLAGDGVDARGGADVVEQVGVVQGEVGAVDGVLAQPGGVAGAGPGRVDEIGDELGGHVVPGGGAGGDRGGGELHEDPEHVRGGVGVGADLLPDVGDGGQGGGQVAGHLGGDVDGLVEVGREQLGDGRVGAAQQGRVVVAVGGGLKPEGLRSVIAWSERGAPSGAPVVLSVGRTLPISCP